MLLDSLTLIVFWLMLSSMFDMLCVALRTCRAIAILANTVGKRKFFSTKPFFTHPRTEFATYGSAQIHQGLLTLNWMTLNRWTQK